MTDQPPTDHRSRDSITVTLLGAFITVLSVCVLIGTFFAQRPHAMAINAAAGVALLVFGVAFILWGRRMKRPR
jgi:drug/metabolite transporter (DMT)-like permease